MKNVCVHSGFFLTMSIGVAVIGIAASLVAGEWHWFSRSGAIVVLMGVLLGAHRLRGDVSRRDGDWRRPFTPGERAGKYRERAQPGRSRCPVGHLGCGCRDTHLGIWGFA